jgi:hypothetical protein
MILARKEFIMGVDYDAYLTFGYSDDQVKSGPKPSYLFRWFEDNDSLLEDLIAAGAPGDITLERVEEVFADIQFLDLSGANITVLTAPKATYSIDVKRGEIKVIESLVTHHSWFKAFQ